MKVKVITILMIVAAATLSFTFIKSNPAPEQFPAITHNVADQPAGGLTVDDQF